MRRRTVLLVCVAVTLGIAEPAWAQDVPVPLPSLEVDVTAAVATATEGLVDVELPTVDVPTHVLAPETVSSPGESPANPSEPVDPAPGAQYQVDEPQYQSDTAAPAAGATTSVADPASAPMTPPTDTPAAPADTPAAPGDTSAAADTAVEVPATWTWEWNWNCEGGASLPAAPANVEGWAWTWNWNCNADADPQIDLGQYQAPITQYQPGNINLGIRIASPGDDGPVTQTISTVTQVTTTVVTEVVQSVTEVVQSVVETVARPVEHVVPVIAAAVPGAAPALPTPRPLLPSAVAGPEVVAAAVETIPLPVLVGSLPPSALPSVTSLPSMVFVPSPRSSGLHTDRATIAPRALAWPQELRPAEVARRVPPSRPAKLPRRGQSRLPLPSVPGGAGAGAAQSTSAPALALGALAAALAAYLLVPPVGARRLRRARDRRRLGLLAAPLERPG